MLVEGRLLPGVTVFITSRPTAQRAFELLRFQRTVEILGFFEDQIKEYVFKFCWKDKSTARKIFDCIDSSLELRSLCYIPVNCYIICLTLKESFINNAEDIPKTITELYKRVVKILLWRHHPRCKSGSIPKPDRGYLIKPLPSELDDEIQKMKRLAKKGMEEGKLIFDETHLTGFENVVNCGLLHQIPDKRRNYFCFLHLTLQEFLAAWCVVDDWKSIGKFLDDHRADPKWHLVIEFVAGLVGDSKKENKRLNIDDVQMRLAKWVLHLKSSYGSKTLGFLGIKCLYELQDWDVIRSVCAKLQSATEEISISDVSFTPVDCNALFKFLSECRHIKKIVFDKCKMLDNHSFVSNNASCNLTSISFLRCDFGNYFLKHFSDALKSENCPITELLIGGSNLSNKSTEYVSEALKSSNCKLTKLTYETTKISTGGVEVLSEALKSKNCKLTELSIYNTKLEHNSSKYLSEALQSEDCKLTKLTIHNYKMSDHFTKCIIEALSNPFCKLTELSICGSYTTDLCIRYLSEALKSENCKLTKLNVSILQITNEGMKDFSEALESENCKLTSLRINSSNLPDLCVEYLSKALKRRTAN
ncbi:NACHT, LRR and PYD domains-containing protein 3-like [Xenia sp. Carnegie-2017]|uniref:NACHT, LRR and PYD domains-containing protein 3-like n=1 Tax=Xenia sp. Carnegie-2017 TaxID=2897299 RepID=UPI001F03A8F8|nr:NACHT, LRR and PYD domains-containing protein 3-like [Xenia sp. Carnegie-2017]